MGTRRLSDDHTLTRRGSGYDSPPYTYPTLLAVRSRPFLVVSYSRAIVDELVKRVFNTPVPQSKVLAWRSIHGVRLLALAPGEFVLTFVHGRVGASEQH